MVEMRDQYLLGEDSNQFIGDVIANTFNCTNNKPITSGILSKPEVISDHSRYSWSLTGQSGPFMVHNLWTAFIIQKATRKFGYQMNLKNSASPQMLFTEILN